MEKILVDEEGYEQFYKELEKIKNELSINATAGASAISDAIGDGWHDNFAFESAMADERKISAKLKKMYDEQRRIKIVKYSNKEDKVNVNDIVKVKINNAGYEEFKLTGKYIPDMDAEVPEISLNSPMGKALYLSAVPSKTFYIVDDKKIMIEIISKIK